MFQAKVPSSNLGLNALSGADGPKGGAEAISRLIAAVRRQAIIGAVCTVAGLAIGAVYVLIAVPLYTATASVMLDPDQLRVGQGSAAGGESTAPDTVIESQLEVFRSEKVLLAVVRQLNLAADPAFASPPESVPRAIWTFLKGVFGLRSSGGGKPPNGAAGISSQELAALGELSGNLKVTRVGRSAVLEVAYTARDPVRAAEIANELVNAYIREQLDVHVQAARNAADWIKKHTDELRQLAAKADITAQKFRAEHNLVATKGTLISEQQLNDIASQLVSDRAATEQAKARYLRLKNIIETHQTHAAVTESLSNPVINDLRTKYLDYAKRVSELERKVGSDHVAVLNMKNTMDELSNLLFQELRPVLESYRNDYEVAAEREKATAENLERQRAIAIATNDIQVQLQQLEQEAASYRTLYESNLKNYRELIQQESYPITEARLIARANASFTPSHPRKSFTLAISLALGAFVGLGIGILREMMDRVFRTTDQVRNELGATALGLLPLVGGQSSRRNGGQCVSSALRYALDQPFSAFAETLRSAKVAADAALQERSPKIIGFVSLLPKEGKSTVAMNFASLLAAQGESTLLIDADTRNPGLTRAIGGKRSQGSRGEPPPPLATLLQSDPRSGLQLLPCHYSEDDPRAAEGLSPAVLQAFLKGADRSFEYVVIDLPPIGPVVNARSLAPVVDAFILVVEWGATSRGAVRSILEKERAISDKLLGVLLNKVKMSAFQSYEHFDSDGYYIHEYRKYFKSRPRS